MLSSGLFRDLQDARNGGRFFLQRDGVAPCFRYTTRQAQIPSMQGAPRLHGGRLIAACHLCGRTAFRSPSTLAMWYQRVRVNRDCREAGLCGHHEIPTEMFLSFHGLRPYHHHSSMAVSHSSSLLATMDQARRSRLRKGVFVHTDCRKYSFVSPKVASSTLFSIFFDTFSDVGAFKWG
ncbi:hypothetical protein CPB85DRAFT_920993 [Mucidula mucida]|nr:hypothetical protein CPB85DRAFT_920993 [Mucidula mucida]